MFIFVAPSSMLWTPSCSAGSYFWCCCCCCHSNHNNSTTIRITATATTTTANATTASHVLCAMCNCNCSCHTIIFSPKPEKTPPWSGILGCGKNGGVFSGFGENLAFKWFRPAWNAKPRGIYHSGRPLLLLLVSCAATNNDVSSMQTMKFMHIELECSSVCAWKPPLYVHIFGRPTEFDRIGRNVGSVPWRLMSGRHLLVRDPSFGSFYYTKEKNWFRIW